MPEVIGVITARGGSKGIPGKNIKTMAGKPMIAWTIEAARQSKTLSRVILSTDDADIARVAREWGVEVPFMRPPELAQDRSSHISVVSHVMDWLELNGSLPEYLFVLQPTSPLRAGTDIDGAIELAFERSADAVVGVSALDHHPYLARKILADGSLAEFISTDIQYLCRQNLPPAYSINGAVYVNRCLSLRRDRTFLPPCTFAYVMPPERSLDVDTPQDFFMVEQLLNQQTPGNSK